MLYLRTEFNPNMQTKLEKVKKNLREYTEMGTFTTITHGKEILINHVMLCKIWYLENIAPADIIQKKRKDIYDFLWNYKKVRVNRNTITLPI